MYLAGVKHKKPLEEHLFLWENGNFCNKVGAPDFQCIQPHHLSVHRSYSLKLISLWILYFVTDNSWLFMALMVISYHQASDNQCKHISLHTAAVKCNSLSPSQSWEKHSPNYEPSPCTIFQVGKRDICFWSDRGIIE